jgi:hypothetical protein
MSRFIYHEPLDPDCPHVRKFRESLREGGDPRFVAPVLLEDFERRHRAECERCHVHGAVHMEIHDA